MESGVALASGARLAMSGARVHRDLIHRKRSPFPEKKEWRVKSGEWSWYPLRERDLQWLALFSITGFSDLEFVPINVIRSPVSGLYKNSSLLTPNS